MRRKKFEIVMDSGWRRDEVAYVEVGTKGFRCGRQVSSRGRREDCAPLKQSLFVNGSLGNGWKGMSILN